MPRRGIAFLLVLTLALPTAAAPRRRAVAKPGFDPSTVSGWLEQHAYVLHSTDLLPWSYDLDPLRTMIGDASIVALGEGTHGTHEFFTVKHRLIDFLVRQMDFDVIGIEAPFPSMERMNEYVLHGAGDPRAILAELDAQHRYFFCNVEELLAVFEWIRDYNVSRGDERPIEVVGVDIYDELGAIDGVLTYLRGVDPAEEARANADYACVRAGSAGNACRADATAVRDRLESRRAAYVAVTGGRAFEDALHYATVVTQFFGGRIGAERDGKMAANVVWAQTYRGTNGKIVLWAHGEHAGEAYSPVLVGGSMGEFLSETHGDDYFSIGTLAGSGTYAFWPYEPATKSWYHTYGFLPEPPRDSYEWFLRQRGVQAFLISLDGPLPSWLAGPAEYRFVGTSGFYTNRLSLPEKFDAVIYVESTTPTTLLR